MPSLVERSVLAYKLTNNPLRCLAANDPCNLYSESKTDSDPKTQVQRTNIEDQKNTTTV